MTYGNSVPYDTSVVFSCTALAYEFKLAATVSIVAENVLKFDESVTTFVLTLSDPAITSCCPRRISESCPLCDPLGLFG